MTTLSVALATTDDGTEDAIAQLLEHRYGDGLIYLRDDAERGLFERAVNEGLLTRDGYLTRAGRSLLARLHYD